MSKCKHTWRHLDGYFTVGTVLIPEIVCTRCGQNLCKPGDMRPAMQGLIPTVMQDIATKYAHNLISQGVSAKVWETNCDEEFTVGITFRRPTDPPEKEATTTITMERNGIMLRFLSMTCDLEGGTIPPGSSRWVEINELNDLLEAIETMISPENMP